MYALVRAGAVVRFYPVLPKTWEGESLERLPAEKLSALGFLPALDVTQKPADGSYILGNRKSVVVFADRVEVVHEVQLISLEQAKRRKFGEIKDRVEEVLAQGVSFGGRVWPLAPELRNGLVAVGVLLLSGATLPPNFGWRDMNDNFVPLTGADLRGLVQALVERLYFVYTTAGNLRDQVRAANTVEEVLAIQVP